MRKYLLAAGVISIGLLGACSQTEKLEDTMATAKDAAGKVSAARKVTVTRVAPNSPIVNTVNNKATTVTGKTEKSATVTVTIGTKIYTAKADAYGTY
ncbi:hypothetical protein J7J00_17420 [Bacillus sp. ISL-4]|nr:hypothetical protein [Bacillus sp. ISL-4]